jgi:hypothetical protein
VEAWAGTWRVGVEGKGKHLEAAEAGPTHQLGMEQDEGEERRRYAERGSEDRQWHEQQVEEGKLEVVAAAERHNNREERKKVGGSSLRSQDRELAGEGRYSMEQRDGRTCRRLHTYTWGSTCRE